MTLSIALPFSRQRSAELAVEQALRTSEIRYRRLFEAARDGILILNAATGEITAVNWFLADLLGYSQEEMLGKKLWEIGPFEDINESKIAFKELQSQQYIRYDDLPLETRDGRSIAVEFVSNVYREGDAKVIQCNIRDITERKRADSERRRSDQAGRLQSAALRAAADAIVITDRTGAIEWVNPAFTQLTGYTTEEAVGRHHRDLVKSDEQSEAFFRTLWETIVQGQTWRGEIINRRKDGSLYTAFESVTPFQDESGTVTHYVTIQRDLTESRKLEAQFRQAQKMEGVGQLASGIAHDFNNLLTVINGMSALVLTQIGQDDQIRADVREIQRAGERAALLTRQLLAFSRQQILEPRVLNINAAIAGMGALLRRVLGEDIDLVIVPAPGLGNIKADPGQLEQVLVNLAVNARDAMPQGGRLTIEAENVTIAEASVHRDGETVPIGAYVRLAVSDSGAGMDETVRARIFEPFFTTKGPGKGTGLGLSTVFGIVKQSHGFIRVYSEAGHGTCFTIYLPQVTEAESVDQPAPIVTKTVCNETLLLVEDDAGLRVLAKRVLERAGYTVLVAAGGDEALRLMQDHKAPVDLMVSDVVMPGMNGRLLAEQLAPTHPGMKVLYMSGYTSDTIVRNGVLEAKMPFLNKPFTPAVLLGKIREVLERATTSS